MFWGRRNENIMKIIVESSELNDLIKTLTEKIFQQDEDAVKTMTANFKQQKFVLVVKLISKCYLGHF